MSLELDSSASGVADGGEAVIYRSRRSLVVRRQDAAGGWAVCKERLGPRAAQQSAHERAVLEALAGLAGVPQLAPGVWAANVVAMHDVGAVPIVLARPLPVADLLDVACQLARTLADMHGRGVTHGDVSPSNLLMAEGGRRVMLVDFDSARMGAEPAACPKAHDPAYLAPEQTGRTGHAVDARADLYGLGATLYYLATGQPPFVQADPVALVREQLTRAPLAPEAVRADLPPMFAAILSRLLEKEPERRYQSADGLMRDLQRIDADRAARFPLGELDFPLRLVPPERLVGRDAEIELLARALAKAADGGARGVLVSGPPGVGKTALIEELRPLAAARQGWFARGKFGPAGDGAYSDGVHQALAALAGLLLAQPEAALAAQRERLLGGLGAHAPLLARRLPEYQPVLGVAPAAQVQSEGQVLQAGLALLRAVASPARPLVLVFDDVQWADAQQVRFVDALLSEPGLAGVLVVVAFRDQEVDTAHPLAPVLDRWRGRGSLALSLALRNLAPPELALMLKSMLRLKPPAAARLASAIAPRTSGNPYDTVEFVNALRRDGVLTLTAQGWQWSDNAIRRYLGHGDIVALLESRIRRLADPSRFLLGAVACLGGRADEALLRAALGWKDGAVYRAALAPALHEGLLVALPEGGVRFPHDRVHEATYGLLLPQWRAGLHLQLARNLAAVPGLESAAAAQYLPAASEVEDESERRRVAVLLRDEAARCRLTHDATAERMVATALQLAVTVSAPAETGWLVDLETAWHAALYRLGRLTDADAIYEHICSRGLLPLQRADAVCVQISSLSNRSRHGEALDLGLGLLRDLGLDVRRETVERDVQARLDKLYRWVARLDVDQAAHTAPMTDPRMLAASAVMDRLLSPAFFQEPALFAWLVMESHRLWAAYGPCPALVGLMCSVPTVTGAVRGDYRIGYFAARHGLAASECLGWEPETSRARHIFSFVAAHWFEPLEEAVRQAQRAREGLLHGGDLQFACFTFHTAMVGMFDCAPTLEVCAAEAEAGLSFAGRTGNEHANTFFLVYRQLLRALRGETSAPGSLSDAGFDAEATERALAAPSSAAVLFHTNCAFAAAVFGQAEALARHSEAAVKLLRFTQGGYRSVLVHLLRVLSLAQQARAAAPRRRKKPMTELDHCVAWLGQRAGDAPLNFAHLHLLAQAERAWALGEFREAALAFDEALRLASSRPRPWHRALIAERAADFHLTHGMARAGGALLGEALAAWRAWGAEGKVRQLLAAWPQLAAVQPAAPGEFAASNRDSVDLLAIVQASQALSSQTSLERLQARVAEILCAITGATSVKLMLRDEGGWNLSTGNPEKPLQPLEEAAGQGRVPLGPPRYVERTGQPLVVDDALRDDRFAADPYFAGLESCALMLLPVLHHGSCSAIVLLESREAPGRFSAESAHAAGLIAGQLAVSLENARLYESLERKVKQRTDALARLNAELEDRVLQRTAQLAQANQELQSFAYSMAHDLRTPLMSIAGFSRLLGDEPAEGARREHYGERIRAGVAQMSALIEALLSLAAVSHAQLSLEEVDLGELALGRIAQARKAEPARSVEFQLQGPMPAHGDLRLMRRLIDSLLSNAWKFSAGRSPALITAGMQEGAGGEKVYFVRDNGVGFDMAYAGKLFQPFHRLHTSHEFEGIGIGLANARSIVARHGGRIWTQAVPNEGATFYFTLGKPETAGGQRPI